MDLSFTALDVGTPGKPILHSVSGRLVPGALLGLLSAAIIMGPNFKKKT